MYLEKLAVAALGLAAFVSVFLGAVAVPGGEAGRGWAAEPARKPIPDAPDGLAVLPFENRSPYRTLDWLRAGVPFVLAERVEHHLGLRPAYGPLVVPAGPMTEDPSQVAALAARTDATWVLTGWVKRPDWKLELSVTLWRVSGDSGERAAEAIDTYTAIDEFANVHVLIGNAIGQLFVKAGFSIAADKAEPLGAAATRDVYAYTLFGRGLAAFVGIGKERNLRAASRDLARAAFIDPTFAEAQRVLGELNLVRHASADPSDKALRDRFENLARGRFERAVELRPRYYAALGSRARLARERGKLTYAHKLYRTLLAARPWDVARVYELGEALWQDGDADGAHRELSRVIDRDRNHLGARRVLALIYAARGDNTDLASELEQIVRLAPDDPQSRLDLAASYVAVGRADDAIAAYRALLDKTPGNLAALKLLGDLYKRSGNAAEAARVYARMLEAGPNDPRPYFLLGAMYIQMGDDRSARQIYRRALRFDGAFYEHLGQVFNNLGAIWYRRGNYPKAIFFLRKAVGKEPRNPRYRYNLALTLSASGDPSFALLHIDAGLRFDPKHVGLRYLRGVALLRQGDRDGARESFEATLELEPNHRDARHNLGLLGGPK